MAKKSKKQLENELNRYGREYELAKRKGDKQGMAAAHAKANSVRKQAGWSYDSKRGYTVEGPRIVNSKENLTLAKAKTRSPVAAVKQVEQSKPITKRYTPTVTPKKPKPKFTQPPKSADTYRTTPQIQTSNAFTAPSQVSTVQSSAPARPVQGTNAFIVPPPVHTVPHPSPETSSAFTAPPSVYEEYKRQKNLTGQAEKVKHDKVTDFWQNWKPGDHVPNPGAYHAEQFALGAYKPLENTFMGLLQAPLDIVDKTGDAFGFGDTPFFKGTEDLARTLAVARLQDNWEESIARRYQPTEQDKAVAKWTQGAGNAAGIYAMLHLTKGKAIPQMLKPLLANGMIGLSGYAGGTNQALMEGADYDTARKYGLLSGGAEMLSERMFDGIPGMKVNSPMTRAIERMTKSAGVRTALNIAGEGAEEMAVAAVDPQLRRWTYDPDAKNATLSEIAEQGFMGSVFAAGMQGAALIGNKVRTGRNSEKNYAHSAPRNAHIPDFEAQWNRYNQMGQSGVRFEDVPPYETETPLDYETAFSAHAAGWNDFIERTTETAKRILAGEETNLGNIAETVVSPDGKQILEEGLGFSFSENVPEAVKQAQKVANALHQKAQQEAAAQGLPLSPEVTSPSERGTVSAENVQQVQGIQEDAGKVVQSVQDTVQTESVTQKEQEKAEQRQQTGVIQNEVSRTVDKKTVKAVSRIAERLGVAVEFTDDMAEAGSYADGKIRINTKSNDLTKPDGAIRQVFVHELTHALEQSGEYQALSQAILSEIDEAGALSEVRQQLRERYAEHGQELDDIGLDREIVAWFSEENLFTDERAINNLARKNRSLFQRIRDWLHGVRVKLRGTAEEKFILQAEKMYTKALDSLESAKPQTLGVLESGQKNNARAGTQYKIETVPGGKQYVKADRPVISGSDPKAWSRQAQNFINDVIRNGQDISVFTQDGFEVQITERSAYKLSDPHVQSVQKVGRALLPDAELGAKMRAAGHIDELLETSRTSGYRPDKNGNHANDIGEKGFDYFSAYFEDTDGQYYRVQISAGINEGTGTALNDDIDTAYSIGDMQKRNRLHRNGSSNSPFGSGALSGVQPISSGNSIAQNQSGSNTQTQTVTQMQQNTQNTPPAASAASPSGRGTVQAQTAQNQGTQQGQGKQNKIDGTESINDIIQRNREQSETIRKLRKQLRDAGDGVVTDPKQVKGLVSSLLDDYSSQMSRDGKARLTAEIQEIYDDIANNTAGNGDIQTRIRQAARDILEHSAVLNTETEADYNGIRKYLKDNKLTLSEQDRADITDYNDFRKSLFGTIKLGNDGIPVDTAYAEMTEMFGEGLFPSDIVHPAEQLTHIADTVRALKPVLENPHTREMDAATRMLSDEIYERFFDLGEHPTRGRRQQRQMDAIRAQANERLAHALEQERHKRDKAIDKLKTQYSEATWERRQRTTQNELRRKITQHVGKLSTLLLKPTDGRHIVENGRQTADGGVISMKKTVAALLETINLESQYSIDPETGKRIYTGETEGQLTKRTEKFRELRAMYEAVESSTDSTMVVDPDLLCNLAELEKMKDVKLSDYTTEQLYTLWNTIRAVESSLTSENKLFSQMRYQDIKSVGERLIADNHTDRPRDSGRGTDTQGVKKAMQDAEDFLEVEMLTPYHYFHQLGDSGRAIFSELSRARGKYITDTDWSLKYLEEMRGDIDTSTWSGSHAELIPFETASGQSGHMTRAQRLSLYLLSKRKQGLKHLTDKNGGIMMHEKGTETVERIVLTKGDIERICAEMSTDERKIAKGLSVAMEHFARWGNESSMKLYGYEKFGEKNYFPIRTERNYRNIEKENAAPGEKGYRIKNAGMTKSTDPGATNPIVLENAFDVFGRHASEMAKYHAFAPVLTDIDRIYNYQQWNEGERGQSVKVMLENKLGKAGTQYWEQLINDVNSGIQRERTPFSGMFSNFKAAKVGANLRVVFQQPLSYIRAGHMIDAKYLVEGLSGKTDTEIMEKYAPIARWKALGYSEMDTGRQLSDMLSGKKETFLEKVRAASMWMPGKADEITWQALWRAVEAETRDTTELESGTDAFYTAVGERFTEIIDRTQVVDTVLNRSGAMRNGGYGHQLGTMFMAEPTLDYNEVMANAKDLKAGKPGAVGRAVRCAKYLTVGAIAKALVCSFVDAGRDKDDDETWTQKFMQALLGLDGTEEGFAERLKHLANGNLMEGINPLTWTPFVKDLVSLAQGFDRKAPDTALAADFLKSVQRLKDAANGEGKTALPAAVVQLLAKTADLSGLPLSNLEREIESAVNSVLLMPVVKNSAAGQQVKFTFRRFHTRLGSDNIRDWVKWGNKNLTDEGVLRSFKGFLERNELATEQDFRDAQAGNKSKELSDLVSAWKDETRNGNTQAAEEIIKQMDSLGYSDKKVQGRLSAAEQALLKETWDFKQKKSDHNVRITDKAAKSRQWKRLSTEQQEFFAARTGQYAGALALSEVDKSQKLEDSSTKWYVRARDAKTVGLSEDQFLIMWTLTKDIEPIRDKDGESIPNSRGLLIMQEIYKAFPGLSEEQYIYLFDARNVPRKAMYTGDSKKHIKNPARTAQELQKLKRKEGK